jgi:hypothetical protein
MNDRVRPLQKPRVIIEKLVLPANLLTFRRLAHKIKLILP